MWLCHFGDAIWPRFCCWLEAKLKNLLEPIINNILPGVLKGTAAFQELSLGTIPPHFGPLSVYTTEDKHDIELRIGVQLITNSSANLTAAGLQLGISNIRIEGTISLVFTPYKEAPPFFGGMEIYMINPPVVQVEFKGVGRMVDFPTIRPLIRNVIANQIANRLVLPNRIAIDMDPDDDVDIAELKCPDPAFVLRLVVLRGKALAASDFYLLREASSDPYVVVSLGATQHTSPVVMKSLNPEWNFSTNYPIHDPSQRVNIKVFDQDMHTSDDLIGVANDVGLETLVGSDEAEGHEFELKLTNSKGTKGAGSLSISVQWMNLSADSLEVATGPTAFLAAKIRQVGDLQAPTGSQPFKIEVAFAGAEGTTRGSYAAQNRNVSIDMQKLCLKLMTTMEQKRVADLLGLEEQDVVDIRHANASNPNDPEVQAAVERSLAKKAATNPQWEEIVQLLPEMEAVRRPGAEVELRLRSAKGELLASTRIAAERILKSEGLRLDGPFLLIGAGLLEQGAQLQGSLRLRLSKELPRGPSALPRCFTPHHA